MILIDRYLHWSIYLCNFWSILYIRVYKKFSSYFRLIFGVKKTTTFYYSKLNFTYYVSVDCCNFYIIFYWLPTCFITCTSTLELLKININFTLYFVIKTWLLFLLLISYTYAITFDWTEHNTAHQSNYRLIREIKEEKNMSGETKGSFVIKIG